MAQRVGEKCERTAIGTLCWDSSATALLRGVLKMSRFAVSYASYVSYEYSVKYGMPGEEVVRLADLIN